MSAHAGRDAAVRRDFSYTHHLVALVGRSEVAAARLAAAASERVALLAARARRESARLSASLDASPLTDETAARVDAHDAAAQAPVDGGTAGSGTQPPGGSGGGAGDVPGGWARALKLDGMPTQDIAALEYANLLAAFDVERDLAAGLHGDPLATLRALHGTICRGLVEPGAAGRLRRTEQAVHDGAQGQVLYTPPPPRRLPALLDRLAEWLAGGSARFPPLVVAGVLHERILQWQPFEAANGRTARAASRLVLRALGVDPHGVAVTERWLAADVLGYHREVAATIRRQEDLSGWVERFGEALCAALEAAADEAGGPLAVEPPARARRYVGDLAPGQAVTLADYARAAGVPLPAARADLEALARHGAVTLEPGSHGLRYRRVGGGGGAGPSHSAARR